MENIDWQNLKFGYIPTNYNVRCYYRNGKWGEIEVSSETTLNIHMAATCLHYGQEAFEGLKAHGCKDGKVRIFRIKANAERLQSTCRGILMPELPTDLFERMVKKVVELNREFVPPFKIYTIVEESNYKLELILKVQSNFPDKYCAGNVVIKFNVPKSAQSVHFALGKAKIGQKVPKTNITIATKNKVT